MLLASSSFTRWGGRNSRGKIAAHVQFDDELDLTPFCLTPAADPRTSSSSSLKLKYQLVAVVMHHGRGFGSGHYTAYCYNPCAGNVFSASTLVSCCRNGMTLDSCSHGSDFQLGR